LLPAELEVELEDGTVLSAHREDYHGFHSNPFDWKAARAKFDRLTRVATGVAEGERIAEVIATLEDRSIGDLTALLGGIRSRAAAA
jgi:2-methylcitrate dehydratase